MNVQRPHEALVEVVSARTGEAIHQSRGPIVSGQKVHLGGEDLRNLGFDLPDYEINTRWLTPEKIWTST